MSKVAALVECENLLVLATHPGEEVLHCGGLIAQACLRGRPPVVAVMTDGGRDTALAEARARRARAAAAALGLPAGRLFLLGLHYGTAPAMGSELFRGLVAGLHFLMWSRDCGVILAPASGDADADCAAAAARCLAEDSAVALCQHGTGAPWLAPPPAQAAKRAALAAYGMQPAAEAAEQYLRPHGRPHR
ncbi:PIG-L family deacetylase [Rhodovarius sp.]|uniref:PIG-L family deacetylase n=1 Tax=Rhodovarius sp. TaxID=2972673 RepID=UPI0034A18924